MGVNRDPVVAADYVPGVSRLVRQTCLEVATRLGDFQDQLCVVGGLVPSLIIPQSELREGEEVHVGTIDLDLGFSVVVLDEHLYEEIAKRLREAGFAPDQNDEGNTTAQRWKSAQGVTVDFLIPPTLPDDKGGRLRNLDENFAALIIPGLDLAFEDSELVTIDDELPTGGRATREIRVCGPASFIVLKALAFGNRGKPKDAYDLYYVLRHHRLGASAIGSRIAEFGTHPQIDEACEILRRDFLDPDLVGPVRVTEFLGGPSEVIQADAAGFVRELIAGVGQPPAV
ncbi:MAG: nucleotidyl transferase AbiEii/AbiGii toxin family protein [Planctomycetes bacterium]|nr:nucleotidyl transferase AbiEii/AbiGii toxin family protein [Planctomycetota bacterium]